MAFLHPDPDPGELLLPVFVSTDTPVPDLPVPVWDETAPGPVIVTACSS